MIYHRVFVIIPTSHSIIKHRQTLSMFPFVCYHYQLEEHMLSYADSERDLGVYINKNRNSLERCEETLTKANQNFGFLELTCHFF